MFLRQITDNSLAQNAYLIGCQRTGEAIIIDPERDVDRYLQLAAENGFRLSAVADTHIHADYLSGARELMERHGARAYLSEEGGTDWQFEWAKGNPNARFLRDGDTFKVGNIEFKAMLSAGHTPEHISFLVTDIGGGASEPIALLNGDSTVPSARRSKAARELSSKKSSPGSRSHRWNSFCKTPSRCPPAPGLRAHGHFDRRIRSLAELGGVNLSHPIFCLPQNPRRKNLRVT